MTASKGYPAFPAESTQPRNDICGIEQLGHILTALTSTSLHVARTRRKI